MLQTRACPGTVARLRTSLPAKSGVGGSIQHISQFLQRKPLRRGNLITRCSHHRNILLRHKLYCGFMREGVRAVF